MSTHYVGIDPGLSGYLAVVTHDGQFVELEPVPTLATGKGSRRGYDLPSMQFLVESRCSTAGMVALERQQGMPGQGVSSTFAIGFGYGLWRMALTACGARYEEPRPAAWKRAMGITVAGCKDAAERRRVCKARAIEKAQQLFPGVELRASKRARKPSADMAEALLLAHYARHRALGVPL